MGGVSDFDRIPKRVDRGGLSVYLELVFLDVLLLLWPATTDHRPLSLCELGGTFWCLFASQLGE